jgi:hypothetical protein
MLKALIGKDNAWSFAVQRGLPTCRTPRRNVDAVAVLSFLHKMALWAADLSRCVRVFAGKEVDLSTALDDDGVFVAVVPLFVANAPVPTPDRVPLLVAVPPSSLRLVAAHRGSLGAKAAELLRLFPPAFFSGEEALLLLFARHTETCSALFAAGLRRVEELLRARLVAAMGHEADAARFARFLARRNRALFGEELFAPLSCSVRSGPRSPEGTLSLCDAATLDPVDAFVATADMHDNMTLTVGPAARVSLLGRVHLHGLVLHQFGDKQQQRLVLKARARQFSSFLLLIGRVVEPGKFDAQFGVVVRDGEDLSVPLDVETVPSAAQFKAAARSIAPEQERFARMYRDKQLSCTLFAVCAVPIRPQLERVLRLPENAMTKEIRLTSDLLELFALHNFSPDLVMCADVCGVMLRVAALRLIVERVRLLSLFVFKVHTELARARCRSSSPRWTSRSDARWRTVVCCTQRRGTTT